MLGSVIRFGLCLQVLAACWSQQPGAELAHDPVAGEDAGSTRDAAAAGAAGDGAAAGNVEAGAAGAAGDSGAGDAGGPTTDAASTDADAGVPPGDAGDAGPTRPQVSIPEAVAADCSVDVTARLQAVLDALEPGSTLRFPQNGCFLVQQTLTLVDREDVVIDGQGSTLRRTELSPVELRYPRHNTHLRFDRVSDLVVRDLSIEGTNTGEAYGGSILDARGDARNIECVNPGFGCYCIGLEFEHGFSFIASSRVRLEASRVDAVWGDGVYVGEGQDVAIIDVEVDRNGRQGIAIVGATGVLIDGARILHSRRGGVDLEPDAPRHRISGVEIRNTQIRSHLLAFPAGGNGEVSDVFIHHNTILGGGTPFVVSRGKAALPRTGWRIEDNVVMSALNSPQPGIRLEYTRAVEIRRNVVPFASARSMTAVGLALDSEAVIECNHFQGAALVSSTDATSIASDATGNSIDATAPSCLTHGRP
jgi:hypothetical protein